MHTLIQVLTGSGLATPIWTLPSVAPFRAWTASSRLAFSRLVLLTYMSRSPGSSRPSCSATPLGTRERITITVLVGSSGSCGRSDILSYIKPTAYLILTVTSQKHLYLSHLVVQNAESQSPFALLKLDILDLQLPHGQGRSHRLLSHIILRRCWCVHL